MEQEKCSCGGFICDRDSFPQADDATLMVWQKLYSAHYEVLRNHPESSSLVICKNCGKLYWKATLLPYETAQLMLDLQAF